MTSPGNTGLADFTVGPYTVLEAVIPEPDATAPPEEACTFAADRIHCVANNLDTSTDMLLAALDAMTIEELGAVQWLSINQNAGLEGMMFIYNVCGNF